jgi:hypothetical protein
VPRPRLRPVEAEPAVSVVLAVGNEEGDIPQIFDRVPHLSRH